LLLFLLTAGIIEYQVHHRALAMIPLRVHVNGTRGKSSVTRLIAAGLRAGGLRTFAKTTGTAPRVIDAEGKDRIIHRLRLPSIGEQVRLMSYFSKEKPDAVVMECMAVQPQYQWIAEHQMIQSHIGVITNTRPDHLEEMGPTKEDVVHSLCNTIPENGTLITGEVEQFSWVKKNADSLKTPITLSDESTVSDQELKQFSYLEHPQNVAVALDVCKKAGVEREIALAGMQKVQPDLGALVVWELNFNGKKISFVNGMAANDPVSTLQIWKFIIDRYPAEGGTCVLLNSREDRPVRTRQMIELTLEEIKPDTFIVRGNKVDSVLHRLHHHSPKTKFQAIDLSQTTDKTIALIEDLPHDALVYAIGNQVGAGQEILNKLHQVRRDA
ncbi:MAG: poly-gamma-glutamate synthase PgsB, partial [Candidatus Marinimicrobia bacterium]|nr:poly-gamma-glutamate synthase PgsB [Candidatus Neomarinimicrobiota bacterium]